jgi:RNA-directed DNA polymerase
MKRYGNIYEKVINLTNIEMAFYESINNSKKRKRKDIQYKLENIDVFAKKIQNNFHISGKYTIKIMNDRNTGKVRELLVPRYFPDQIIHHALTRQTLPYINKKIMHECCCSIKGRGTLYGSMLVRKALKIKGVKYYAQFDIKKYFPNVNQDILVKQLENIFKDKQIIDLYKEIIYSVPNGIPLGNYTSQSLSNLYLTPLDRYIKQMLRIKYYVRYADDFVIIGRNKRELNRAIPLIANFLKNVLKLEIHENVKVYSIYERPIDFCGYKHYKEFTTIRKRNWKKARRMLLRETNLARAKRLMAYLGYIIHSSSYNIIQRFNKVINNAKIIISKGVENNGIC